MRFGRIQATGALCAALVAMTLVTTPATPLHAGEHRVYEYTIPDEVTWRRLAKKVGSDCFTKFIIDLKSGAIYFIDVNLFKLHSDFVFGVLLKTERTEAANRQYNLNYTRNKPRFILGYLTHHLKVDVHTFAFWAGDAIDAKSIRRVYDLLEETFYIKDLVFRPDSPMQETEAKLVAKMGVKTTTNDALYKAAPYQAFNKGEAVGRLRVVPVGTPYESLLFERTDIVLLQESYPDISPVSGILATVFSTPLAHVNLRARAWNIPNAGFVDAREAYGALDGEMVYMAVDDARHVLRQATSDEIAAAKMRALKRRQVTLPKADLDRHGLAMLTALGVKDSLAFGTKTANLGAIASPRLPGVHVPPGFGIPFAHYHDHMTRHGLDKRVTALLDDARWSTDRTWRQGALKALRDEIRAAEIDPSMLDRVEKLIR
ncbi:MAG: PEP/pyruvate-binding domain-containing protein, partial [Myxococcota bacterium]|nr:PEP/pyruvate-binding domain-containing protein [Myxococcota bacterium]